MSRSRDLAARLARSSGPPPVGTIRLGTVTAVGSRNDGGTTYTVVTIDGIVMRCLSSYATPTAGHVVVWLQSPGQSICLGTRL